MSLVNQANTESATNVVAVNHTWQTNAVSQKGNVCHKCGKIGHFSNVCRSEGKGRVRYMLGKDSSTNKGFVLVIGNNDSAQTILNKPYPIKFNGRSSERETPTHSHATSS